MIELETLEIIGYVHPLTFAFVNEPEEMDSLLDGEWIADTYSYGDFLGFTMAAKLLG